MITSIKNFFIGSYNEFQKVIWPNRAEVISHTSIVLISIIISMAIIAAIDYGLLSSVQYLVNGRGV